MVWIGCDGFFVDLFCFFPFAKVFLFWKEVGIEELSCCFRKILWLFGKNGWVDVLMPDVDK